MDNHSLYYAPYSTLFIKLVIAIILVYALIYIIYFLRDMFLKSEHDVSNPPQLLDLLSILQRLFYFSGFGFVIGNILQVILSRGFNSQIGRVFEEISGEWYNLGFGIVLIFVSIGLKAGKNSLVYNNSKNK